MIDFQLLSYVLAGISACLLILLISCLISSRNQLKSAENDNRELQAANKQYQYVQENLYEDIDYLRDESNQLKQTLAKKIEENNQYEINSGNLNYQIEILERNLDQAVANYQEEKSQLATTREAYYTLQRKNEVLSNQMRMQIDSHQRELASFEKQKNALSEQFKVLSNEILERKSRNLQESSQLSLNSAITPFKESLESLRSQISEIHNRETAQYGELRGELQLLKELNHKITNEAHELSVALKGEKKTQGNWGELVLENILDKSGLNLGKDYVREASFNTEEGKKRPDVIVNLPQNKHLIIDAKVSLNAYTRYINSEDKNVQQQALKSHVQAVKARITDLSSKEYQQIAELNTPEIVFLFIPIESAFIAAFKEDETLFQYAMDKDVLIATPTTLLTSLNIIRQLWRHENQNQYTLELTKKADSVFKKLNNFLGSFEKVKRSLDTAQDAYKIAEGQLVSGKGNLVKQVADFKNLAPIIRAELPQYYTEKANLELDQATLHENNNSNLDLQ